MPTFQEMYLKAFLLSQRGSILDVKQVSFLLPVNLYLTISEIEGFCCGYKPESISVACSKLQIVPQFYSLTLQYDIDKC